MSTKRFGFKPSLPDIRDIPVDTGDLVAASEVDIRADMDEPYDQGDLGSCTSNAVAGALAWDHYRNTNSRVMFSRLFIYYEERVREGTVNSDAGAWGRDGFVVSKHEGAPPEDVWPYHVSQFDTKPPVNAYDWALDYRIDRFRHVPRDVDTWKKVLSNYQPIAFGFSVYESFYDAEDTGIVPFPSWTEGLEGGHEVLAVGYLQDYPDHVLCRNSWSSSWGPEHGYFLMEWKYIMSILASDFRTIPAPIL